MSRECQARRHMTPEEYGLYVYVSQVGFRSGVLYADARRIAREFGNTSKGTIYRLLAQLTQRGWLRITKQAKRQASGVFSATEYELVGHSDWIKAHPGKCPVLQTSDPVPKSGLESKVASSVLAKSRAVQSGNRDHPVRKSGQSSPEIENVQSGNPDIDLEVSTLNKALNKQHNDREEKERASTSLARGTDVRFQSKHADDSERNRQLKRLLEWRGANGK